MANSTIGSLLIELKAKTDAFERGMKSAKDLSFATAGDIVNSLEKIGGSLGKMHFGSIDQGVKSLGILGGVATATGVALGAALIAVAEKSSERMIEMGHSAEKAGMDIKSFTEYAYAFKVAGVPLDALTRSMSFLAKNALEAAQGNRKLQEEFRLAGTSAIDLHTHALRPTADILEDIIKKYASLSNATLKAALAREVFGRGGSMMIPGLDRGPEWIKAMREEADRLGVAFDEHTLEQVKNFRMGLAELKGAGEGAATQFTAGLLPAMNDILGAMTKVEGHSSAMRDFGNDVGEAMKFLAKNAMAAYIGLKMLYLADFKSPMASIRKQTEEWAAQGPAAGVTSPEKLLTIPLKAAFTTDAETEKQINELQKKYDDFILKLEAGKPVTGKEGKGATGPDPAITALQNQIVDRIAKLKAQVDAEAKLATSIGDTTSATLLNTAAAEAQKIIEEMNAAGKSKNIQVTKQQAESVRQLTTLLASYKEALGANKELEDSIQKTSDATKETLRLADAYGKGAEAVKAAEEHAKVAPFEKTAGDIQDVITALRGMGFTDKELQPLLDALAQMKQRLAEVIDKTHEASVAQQLLASQKLGSQIRFDTEELDKYIAALDRGDAAIRQFAIDQQLAQFRRETPNLPETEYGKRGAELASKDFDQQISKSREFRNQLDDQIASLRSYTSAVLGGAAALRQFNINEEMLKFERANPNLPPSEYDNRRKQLQDIANQEATNAAAERVHALERYKDIDDEIRQLQRLREQEQLAGQPTTATDQALRSAQNESAISRAETGGVGAGIRGGIAQLNQEWGSWGRQSMQATSSALHGMQNSFHTFFNDVVMGTKSIGQAFAELGRNILSSIVNALAEMLARWITTHLIMAAVSKIFGQDAGNSARVEAQRSENMQITQSDAGVDAANAFMWALGESGDIWYALEQAAVAYAIGSSFTALASAAGGMEVDRDQLALVHKNEKILPARISQGFDRIINNYSTTSQSVQAAQAAGQASYPNLPPITIHVNGAQDPDLVAQKVSDSVMARVKRNFRTAGVSR